MSKSVLATLLLLAAVFAATHGATCCSGDAPTISGETFSCASDCVWEYVGNLDINTAINVTQQIRVLGNVYLGRGAELAFNAVGQLNVTSGCLSVNSTAAALVINIRNAFDLLDFIKTTPTLIKFDTACAVQTLPTFQTVVTLPCVTLTPSCQTGVGCKIDYTTSTDCAPPVAGNFIRFVVNFNVSSIIDVQKISSTINSIRDTLADFFPGLDIEDFANLDLQPIVANATTYIASLDVPEPPALLRSFINTFGIDGLILRTLIGDAVSTVLGGLGVEVNSISSQDYDTPSAAAMAIPQLAIILATAGTALFGMRFF